MMAGTFVPIESVTLASSAASVTFSAIPQTYTDLVVRVSARGDFANIVGSTALMRFNGSSASNYSYTFLDVATSSTARSGRGSNTSFTYGISYVDASGTANTFGSSEIYIPNYTGTTYKPASLFGVGESNNSDASVTTILVGADLRSVTDAITSITFLPNQNFVAGSTFHLYGIKNS